MELFDFFKLPKNPKLKFGEALSDVCRTGALHTGLKDLFLKAYLSAKGEREDAVEAEDKTPPVLLALKSGPRGQGSLHQRMSLKTKLEAGEWLLAVQTPSGAPLWLLRHFLGRLPQPILEGPRWKTLGEACGDPELYNSGEVLERICMLTKALSKTEFQILALLALMIKNLSYKKCEDRSRDEFSKDILNALSEYFTASITVRPFRPGLHTKLDKKYQPLLIFLARNWNEIFLETSRSKIVYSTTQDKEPHKSQSGELYSYFRNDSFKTKKQKNNLSKFIGFESLLKHIDQSKESSDYDVESEDLSENNTIDDFNLFSSDIELDSINVERISNELDKLANSESETMTNKHCLPESEFFENVDTNNHNVIRDPLAKNFASSSALIFSKTKKTSGHALHKSNPDIHVDSEIKLVKNEFNLIEEDCASQLDCKNTVKSSSTECEFFSVPNSENSD